MNHGLFCISMIDFTQILKNDGLNVLYESSYTFSLILSFVREIQSIFHKNLEANRHSF